MMMSEGIRTVQLLCRWLLLVTFTEAVHGQQLQFLSMLLTICFHKEEQSTENKSVSHPMGKQDDVHVCALTQA